jgi:hypothetical protein
MSRARLGHLLGGQPAPAKAKVTPLEQVKIIRRRVAKAERDERMDLTRILTPVRTFEGGFTRPTDLRSSNWWTGGAYMRKNKNYEMPTITAYKPHVLFVLQSRYLINWGIGRVPDYDYLVGVCTTEHFEDIVEGMNSVRTNGKLLGTMDNAQWPFGKLPKPKLIRWWEDMEDYEKVVSETRQLTDEDREFIRQGKAMALWVQCRNAGKVTGRSPDDHRAQVLEVDERVETLMELCVR